MAMSHPIIGENSVLLGRAVPVLLLLDILEKLETTLSSF